MARQTIDLGTSPNKGDGDPLRIAFDKINDNFAELYAGDFADPGSVGESLKPDADSVHDLGSADRQWADLYVGDFIYLNGVRIEVSSGGALLVNGRAPAEVQDTVGSVFGDDSTLLVDGVNNIIPSANISGTEAANWDTAFLWGDHSAAGYAPQATTYTKVEVDAAIAAVDPFSGDVTGSVFADDSTLLVDGVAGMVVGDIQNNLIETNNITALPGDTDLYIQGGYYSGTPGNPARVNIGTTNTSTIVLGAGDAVIYVNGNASSEVAAGTGRFDTIIGDLTGSVFGDDSTLLVDGVNGVIPNSVLAEYASSITTNPADPTATANHVLGNTGEPSEQGASTAWYYGDVVSDPANPTTSVVLNIDSGTFIGDVQGELHGNVKTADGVTLLVDGTNGVIPTSVLEGDITNPIRTGDVVIESTTSPGSVTITHAGIGGITLDASTSTDGISLEGDVSVAGSFTPPMLTQAEIDALTPTLGMMVYNTTTGKFQGYAADANNDSTTGWADLH